MKTFLVMELFLLICSMGVMAQTIDNKSVRGEFTNQHTKHAIFPKGQKQELQHPILPITSTANQFKSKWTGGQQLDSTIYETWDSTSSQLVVSVKAVYTYDANWNRSLRIDYLWDETTGQWFIAYKTEYSYDANGNNTLSINYQWFENPNIVLYKFYKGEGTFDANGNEILYIGYFWVESISKWIASVKEERTYDANGKETLIINYDGYEIYNQWVAYMKREYSYDINGDMTSVNYFSRDTANTQWLVYAKDEYSYENNGSVLFKYEYDADLSQWFNFSKIETTYDADGNSTTINYFWNRTHSQWDAVSKTADYYSQRNVTSVPAIPEGKINVYPNPASGYVIFNGSNVSGSVIVELFDLQGKKVLEHKLSENKQISVSNITKGLYMYKLNNNGIINTGKLLIE